MMAPKNIIKIKKKAPACKHGFYRAGAIIYYLLRDAMNIRRSSVSISLKEQTLQTHWQGRVR